MRTVLSVETPSDADLLDRFVREHDDSAFTELVRRYGPVVRAACRRALGNTPDADDVFQAVFLILVRKGGTLRHANLLGPWLHTVAVRASSRARMLARRRLTYERQVTDMPEPAITSEREPADWVSLLDDEIERLPERLRLPLVLCELQGVSRNRAAQELGIPEGTLSSRLARARKRLRNRLQRKGIVIQGTALSAAFLTCSEAVPAALLAQTTIAALFGSTSASVAALTQGVLKTMLLVKMKFAAIVVLTLGITSGALILGRHALVLADDQKAN